MTEDPFNEIRRKLWEFLDDLTEALVLDDQEETRKQVAAVALKMFKLLGLDRIISPDKIMKKRKCPFCGEQGSMMEPGVYWCWDCGNMYHFIDGKKHDLVIIDDIEDVDPEVEGWGCPHSAYAEAHKEDQEDGL